MNLDEATIEDIILELKNRPIRFALVAMEERALGKSWVKWSRGMDTSKAASFLASASEWVALQDDDWA